MNRLLASSTARRLAAFSALGIATAGLVWVLFVGVPRWSVRPTPRTAPPAAVVDTSSGRKIKAHLFYVGESGTKLASVEQDVPYGEGTLEQAKAIINAQVAAAADPLVSAVPAGTTLRAIFVTAQGEAYLDLSDAVSKGHPGGSLNEMLTVYALVNALTTNLPAISAVQLLVDGKEVDTLAGHVDLRRPLVKNLDLVE